MSGKWDVPLILSEILIGKQDILQYLYENGEWDALVFLCEILSMINGKWNVPVY